MSRVPYDLTDKVVLITGGNGGIGAATARALLDRGAKVGIADIDPTTPDRAVELHPTNAFGCVADVRDRASLEVAVAQTVNRFGRLDVVMANAGLRFTQDRRILDVLARLDARPDTSPVPTPAAPSRRKKS